MRLALGAQARHLIGSVLQQGLTPVLIGMIIGLCGSLAAGRIMESMLFEVQPWDVMVFASVGCVLLLVSVAASLVPALRTTGIDPAQVLRAD